MNRFIKPLVFLLLLESSIHAKLNWDPVVLTMPAKLGQDSLNGTFTFKNVGPEPVTILDIKPGCGCITVTLDRNRIGSGESGVLRVSMDTTKFSGFQEKSIQVLTDDAPGKPISLTLRTTIPTAVEITPRLLTWDAGAENIEKEVSVLVNQDAEVKIQSVSVDNLAFIAFLDVVDEGKSYRIRVRPLSTKNTSQTMVRVSADVVGAAPRNSAFVVQIR